MLGSIQHPQHQQKGRSPSYFRRQERRKAARAAEEPILVEDDDVSEEATKRDESDKKDSSNQEKNAGEATLSFDCEICDFNSNSENGLSIHMSKKHRIIEQIDDNNSFAEDIQIHILRMRLKSILQQAIYHVKTFASMMCVKNLSVLSKIAL